MTRIKSRIFFTNISYNGVKEEDLFDRSFCFQHLHFNDQKYQPVLFGEKNFRNKRL